MQLSTSRSNRWLLLSIVILASLSLLSTSFYNWQLEGRLDSTRHELSAARSFQAELQELAALWLNDTGRPTSARDADSLARIDELLRLAPPDDKQTRALLNRMRSAYRSLEPQTSSARIRLLTTLQSTSASELLYREQRIDEQLDLLRASTRLSIVVPGALLFLLLVLLFATWRRTGRGLLGSEDESQTRPPGNTTSMGQADPTSHHGQRSDSTSHPAQTSIKSEESGTRSSQDTEQKLDPTTRDLIDQQRALARVERLSVSVEFAASLAHEVRNPLAAIQMSLSNLQSELEDDEITERVERISAEVIRLGSMVGDAVEFTRGDAEPASQFDLLAATDELFRLARYQVPSRIELDNQVPDRLVCCLPRRRLQVTLLNLIANSATAIGEGTGRIKIEARPSESNLEIVVTDDGPGFPESVLVRGIHAFRGAYKDASGLGLAMARRLVRERGGEIELSNRSSEEGGRGARVALLLPSCIENG
ncbi:MAG: HAMP domain-containing sensor histidine kinase [Myxococcota bacterium]|nr:HAMP domain-containing sensor histidine kinase [Myxococcota bacterium]